MRKETKQLSENILGQSRLIILDSVDSTNNVAKNFAKNGSHPLIPYSYDPQESYLIAAREQTGGRGRLGRAFSSVKDKGLYMSYLFPRGKSSADVISLTAYLAVAVRDAILETCGLDTKIKWVNDLYAEGKKIAGILAEGAINPDGGYLYRVAGIGVNIYKRNFGELSDVAASIEDFAHPPSLKALLEAIEKRLSRFGCSSRREFMAEYRRHSLILGKEIKIILPSGESFNATAEDVLEGGELSVRRDGEIMIIRTADVSVRPI